MPIEAGAVGAKPSGIKMLRRSIGDQADMGAFGCVAAQAPYQVGHDGFADSLALMGWVYGHVGDLECSAAIANDAPHANQGALMQNGNAVPAIGQAEPSGLE